MKYVIFLEMDAVRGVVGDGETAIVYPTFYASPTPLPGIR